MVGRGGGQLVSGRGAVSPAYCYCSVPQHVPRTNIDGGW